MKKNILTKVAAGKKIRVVEISAGQNLQRRLMGMGIYPGREITKVSQMMLHGPVAVKVGQSVVALGHGTAAAIWVEYGYQ